MFPGQFRYGLWTLLETGLAVVQDGTPQIKKIIAVDSP